MNQENPILLVVDDRPDNLYIIEQLVGEYLPNCTMHTALNAEAALRLVGEVRPDGILCDIQMPGTNGIELCRRLKGNPETRNIPVVLMTAHKSEPQLRVEALEAGADDFISKPIDNIELAARLKVMFRVKHAQDNLEQARLYLEAKVAARTVELKQKIMQLEQIETALRKSESKQRVIIENIVDVIAIMDMDGIISYVSPNVEKWFGWRSDEVIGRSIWKNIHPDSRGQVRDAFSGILSELLAERTAECRHKCKDGRFKWIEFTGVNLLRDADISGILMSFHDVTERKAIEETQQFLLQSAFVGTGEDFFASLARYLARALDMDYVCIDRLLGDGHEARTLAIYFDGVFEDNVEYALKDTPCGDVVGKSVCVFPCEVRHQFPDDVILQEMLAESYVGTTLWSFDGKPIGLIAVIGRKPLENHHLAESLLKLVAVRAASELERTQAEEERRQLERQFQQTQKLESLGVLAGGIAHDFNNILAIIMGHCFLAKNDVEAAAIYIPQIEKTAERAADLCRQMLAYAGKAQLSQSQVDIRALVEDMVRMLCATIPKNAEIRFECSTEIPCIKGDASQLRQIVMNLIINASEAISNSQGEIHILLSQKELRAEQGEKDHLGAVISPGKYVCLEVSDNGCGMDAETQQRIFEPFYTTKFAGRGLGMSAVLGIITAHLGALQFSSLQGQGTSFKVYLPLQANGTEARLPDHHPVQSTPWQGSGTVLLAEDEEQVKMIARFILEKLGFGVIEASNGREALELYRKHAGVITLVLTDMGMPVMDGYELFRELKKLDPSLPVVISSGFGDTVVTSRIAQKEIAGLVSKPYNVDQLRTVLKGVMEGAC